MKIAEVTKLIEDFAPLSIQESWDNAGMQVGNSQAEATGALLCLDVTEAIVEEAVKKGINLIITHHPLLFRGLKSITGKTIVERVVIKAIKSDVTIYSAHTNMDSAWGGVSHLIAKKIGLENVEVLCPQSGNAEVGLGVVGNLQHIENALEFMDRVKKVFAVKTVRYSGDVSKPIRRVAICGGAGSEFVRDAMDCDADVLITGDIKYHEFMSGSEGLLLVDIGHYESECFIKELFNEIITKKIPNFAVHYAELEKNPINYL